MSFLELVSSQLSVDREMEQRQKGLRGTLTDTHSRRRLPDTQGRVSFSDTQARVKFSDTQDRVSFSDTEDRVRFSDTQAKARFKESHTAWENRVRFSDTHSRVRLTDTEPILSDFESVNRVRMRASRVSDIWLSEDLGLSELRLSDKSRVQGRGRETAPCPSLSSSSFRRQRGLRRRPGSSSFVVLEGSEGSSEGDSGKDSGRFTDSERGSPTVGGSKGRELGKRGAAMLRQVRTFLARDSQGICGMPLGEGSCGTVRRERSCGTPLRERSCGTVMKEESCGTALEKESCSTPRREQSCLMPLREESCGMALGKGSCSTPLREGSCGMPHREGSCSTPLREGSCGTTMMQMRRRIFSNVTPLNETTESCAAPRPLEHGLTLEEALQEGRMSGNTGSPWTMKETGGKGVRTGGKENTNRAVIQLGRQGGVGMVADETKEVKEGREGRGSCRGTPRRSCCSIETDSKGTVIVPVPFIQPTKPWI